MNTSIKITVENTEKIQKSIDQVECRATARTASAFDLFEAVRDVTARLDNLGVLKKNRNGMKFHVCPEAQKFPSAYKYNPEATCFWIKGTATSWVLTSINRASCPAKKIQMSNEKDFRQYFNF